MTLTQGTHTLELTTREAQALYRGICELQICMEQSPHAQNGFDLTSQGIVENLRKELTKIPNIGGE